jgi:Spy/CpxP family protein refolding chaperone
MQTEERKTINQRIAELTPEQRAKLNEKAKVLYEKFQRRAYKDLAGQIAETDPI